MRNRNKSLIITSIVFLSIAILTFVIGGFLEGWDFAGWFTSQTAYWIYTILGLYIIIVVSLILKDKVRNL